MSKGTHGPGRLRALLKAGLIILVGLGLTVAGAELLLRWLAPEYGSLYFSLTRTGGHPITYNRHGFRDPERPWAKAPGTIRFLALGDSVTWGYGVADRELYLRVIERLWNRSRRHRRLEIWNMAGMGRSARMFLPHLNHLLAYRPDAAIIQINLNDVGDMISPPSRGVPITTWETPAAEQARKLRSRRFSLADVLRRPALLLSYLRLWLTRTYLGSFLIVQATRLSYRLGLRKKDPAGRNRNEFLAFQNRGEAGTAWVEFLVNLTLLTENLRWAGVKVMWVIFPYRYQIDRHPPYLGVDLTAFSVDPQARIVFWAGVLGVPVLDLRPAFGRARRAMTAGQRPFSPLFLILDPNHPDRDGHRVAGRAIYRFILRRRWLVVPSP